MKKHVKPSIDNKKLMISIIILTAAHFMIVIKNINKIYTLVLHGSQADDIKKYALAFIMIIILSVNLLACIGLLRSRKWGWWCSGVFLVSHIPIKIIYIFNAVSDEIKINKITYNNDFISIFLSDSILAKIFLLIIILVLLKLLFHKHIFDRMQFNIADRKRYFTLLLIFGPAFTLIDLSGILLENLLCK